jgi:DNA-binding Lrp family transcriptional regulator
MIQLDTIDKKILELLRENAKLTVKEISQNIHLSHTPTYERIKRLEKEGIITGYHARIDRSKIGLGLLVICTVSLDTHKSEFISKFEKDIVLFDEVLECYHIAGLYDYQLKVAVKDMAEYQKFVSTKLASLDHIGKVESFFVMKEVRGM